MSRATEHDAVVVGSGPNGLVAAITLARAGRRVLLLEAADVAGGGLRSAALTEPGYVHDVCSSVHPLALASPAFADLPLAAHGLEWAHPVTPLAHPLDGGRAALLRRSVTETAGGLAGDGARYAALLGPLVAGGDRIARTVLSPFRPRPSVALARFATNGLRSASGIARRFETEEAAALLAGTAAHSLLPLTAPVTGGYGLFLTLLAHRVGWPVARGGSARIADALLGILADLGAEVVTGHRVTDLRALPPTPITVLDLTPRQVIAVAGDVLPHRYRRRLAHYRYGPGVFKVDWALDGPVPWTSPDVADAATVHLGGTFAEVAAAEAAVARGGHPERPFVIFVQPTVADPSRAPAGAHTAWAYCHVPLGSTVDRTDAIEAQVDRFAPGFRDRVVARHVMDTAALERHDANLVGGDINGGRGDLRQLVARPVLSLRPWGTPVPGLFLCSAATPPGGGVHGMGGLHAARAALAWARRSA